MLILEQGSQLIKLARISIRDYSESKNLETFEIKRIINLKEFSEKQGVFVTLHTYPDNELRGCIGLPYPTMPLGKAVIDASRSSAYEDPRFSPLVKEDLDKIIIEISVLTKPKLIDCKPTDLSKSVKVGKDGLIIKYHDFSGLLLPQVPIEQNWTAEEFIEQTCQKAGLAATTWKNKDCKFYKFQAQIFSEKKPNGEIEEKS